MIKKLIFVMLRRHHFWRDIGFDELSEIYANRLIATVALSLVGIFVPIYLYDLGYSVSAIAFYFAQLVAVGLPFVMLAALLVARFGAKRVILASQLVQVIALLLYASLPEAGWPLWLLAGVQGLSINLYYVAFHSDFSKVKHVQHGGKELGWAVNFEKAGLIIGPLLGGVLATIFSPQLVFYVACGLVVLAAIPFFATKEAMATRQHLSFRGLSVSRRWRDYASYAGLAIDNTASIALWPLYLAVVLTTTSIYQTIGVLSAIGVATSFLFIHVIGKLIDNRRIRLLYTYGVAANALVHCARPLVLTTMSAALLNVAKEQTTNSFRLPYIKAFYDQASNLPGHRIAYVASMEMSARAAQTVFWAGVGTAAYFLDGRAPLQAGFLAAAVISLLLYVQRYAALKR